MAEPILKDLLPELSYVFVEDAEPGKRIGIIKRGESGYHLTDYDRANRTNQDASQIVDNLNGRMKVSKAQAAAMYAGSLFSWNIPAADPRKYDEDGKLRRPSRQK